MLSFALIIRPARGSGGAGSWSILQHAAALGNLSVTATSSCYVRMTENIAKLYHHSIMKADHSRGAVA